MDIFLACSETLLLYNTKYMSWKRQDSIPISGIVRCTCKSVTECCSYNAQTSFGNLMREFYFTEECKKEVARFAKNFLPILFNLFTTEPENTKDTTRLAVLETTKCYLHIADTAVFILQ